MGDKVNSGIGLSYQPARLMVVNVITTPRVIRLVLRVTRLNYVVIMRIFVLTATYELRVSRKSHLRDHPIARLHGTCMHMQHTDWLLLIGQTHISFDKNPVLTL